MGNRVDHVHQTHQHVVSDTAEIAGNGAKRNANDQHDGLRQHADHERHLRAVDHAAENVSSVGVQPHWPGPGRVVPCKTEVHNLCLAIWRNDGGKDRNEREGQDNHKPDNRQLVLAQTSPGVTPEAPLFPSSEVTAEDGCCRSMLPGLTLLIDELFNIPVWRGHRRVGFPQRQPKRCHWLTLWLRLCHTRSLDLVENSVGGFAASHVTTSSEFLDRSVRRSGRPAGSSRQGKRRRSAPPPGSSFDPSFACWLRKTCPCRGC